MTDLPFSQIETEVASIALTGHACRSKARRAKSEWYAELQRVKFLVPALN